MQGSKKREVRTDSAVSLTLWVKLDFRAWQWAQLLRVDPGELKGRHLWIHPVSSAESQSCEPLKDLEVLLDHYEKKRLGAGLVNLDLAAEIDARRDQCRPVFAQGAVWPHAGDRQAIENLGFDTTACRWFTTQITPGETGDNWQFLLRVLRLEAARDLVHIVHDAANLLGVFQTARHRLPDATWTRIAAEIREDSGGGAFDRQLRKVRRDLQTLVFDIVTPLRLKGDLPAEELQVLEQLVSSLESALETIARLADPRSTRSSSDPAAHFDSDLATWRTALDQIGRIQL